MGIYSYLIANWLNGGGFINRGKMSPLDILPEYNVIFTKSSTKKVYRITGLKPENADMCFIDYIRESMFALHPNVETIFTIHNYPTKLDVTSDKFNRQMARASESYTTYREAFESQSGLAKLTGKTYRMPNGARLRLSKERLDDLRQVFLSYYYLYNYVASGGTLTLTEIFIEFSSEDTRAVKTAGNDLRGLLLPLNIGCEEVRGVTKSYLREHGPAAPIPLKLNKRFLPQLLFSEENSVAFSSYKACGLVGEKGLLMGVDFRSRLPFSIDLFAAPSAQVFLLMGKTGSGKTYTAWQMALSALALGEYVTAIDIKGREWARLVPFTKSKIITFDERNPSFVNTLRLDDMTANHSNAAELFNTAVRGTIQLLMLIVNLQENEGNPNDLELVLREAVLKLYSIKGVSPDNPSSFELSGSLKYSDILPILESLSTTVSYTESQRKMVALARARCHSYLGSSGIFSDAFQNEITLSEVLSTPLVIYEFNKNQNAMTDALDVLRIFMVQFLDSKKKAMLREQGNFLFCFYEELQRCDQFGNLLQYIAHDTTGSRSNNAVIVLLLNSLRVLQDKSTADIRSNITSYICGAVEENDIESFRNEFNKPWLAHQLELFADHPNVYRNCFAAMVDTGAETMQTVFKVKFPESLRAKFQTRTTRG